MASWYARPVLFVADMPAARAFYTERLGFEPSWHYEEDGRTVAAQVNRGECEVILNVAPDRAGRGRLFISLEADELEALQGEIEARSIPATRGWWGMPVLELRDPDGNELFFPVGEE